MSESERIRQKKKGMGMCCVCVRDREMWGMGAERMLHVTWIEGENWKENENDCQLSVWVKEVGLSLWGKWEWGEGAGSGNKTYFISDLLSQLELLLL